jgi:tetratricopeptide (TPR) repeat protein
MYPWERADLRAWKVLGAVLVLAAVTVGAFRWRRARPYFVVGWLWYLGMLVPVSGLLQVGEQTMADRFTYLPQIGLCIALVLSILDICRNWRSRRWWYAAGATCALAALSAWAWRQTTFWSDSKTLWSRDLACTSVNSIALLGYAAAERGGSDEAIARYRYVLERNTAFPRLDRHCHAQAHASLGQFLADRGRSDEAMSHFRSALELGPIPADAHNSFGFLLAGRGRLDEAISHYQAALSLKPDYAEAHNNLGVALVAVGRADEAIAHFRLALQMKPDLADAHYNLGVELAGRGQISEAMIQFRTTLKIKPDNARAHNNLGVALALGGRTDEALGHFRKALEIASDYPEAHRNLGDLQAQRGRIDQAIEHYQQALALARQQRKAALVEELRTRLQHYGADVPQP